MDKVVGGCLGGGGGEGGGAGFVVPVLKFYVQYLSMIKSMQIYEQNLNMRHTNN